MTTSMHGDKLNLDDATRCSLAAHYRDCSNIEVNDVEVEQVVDRPFSSVAFLRVVTPAGIDRLVMKRIEHNPVNKAIIDSENQALVEYNILTFLHEKFKSVQKCHVPRPLLAIPEKDTYIMEFVDGTNLMDEFRYANYFSSRRAFRSLREYCYLSGLWLRSFQEFTGERPGGKEAFDTTLERCEYRIRVLEDGNDPRWPKGLGRRIMGYLREQMDHVCAAGMVTVTGRHGDFGPWNMIVGRQGVTVIDFLGYKLDLIPTDYLKMQMFLENSSREFACANRRIEDLKECFKAGYGKTPLVPKPIVASCEILHRVCNVFGFITSPAGRFHHRLEQNRCIKANLDWLKAFGEGCTSLWC